MFGIAWEPVGFFPLRAVDSASYYAQTLVYEGLVRYNERMEVCPGVAERFSVSEDGLSYRFRLRQGARFSSGEEIKASDVLESVRLASSKYSPYRDDYKDVKDMTLNGDELVMTLSRPCAPLLNRLVELRILPARLLKLPDKGRSILSRTPISSGPFVLRRWESGLELVFEPNQMYWGEKPRMRRLVWRVVPEMGLLALSLNRGDIDAAQVDARSYRALLSRNKELVLDSFCGSRTVYVGFNLERSPWKDVLVRRAIAMSIDRSLLARDLLFDFAFVPDTDFSPGRWSYEKSATPLKYDPPAARTLLSKAGFSLIDGNWVRVSGGKTEILAFKMQTAKDYLEMAECVSSQLAKNHIRCEVEVVEFSALRNRYLKQGEYDVVLWSRSSGPDPECVLVWSSTGAMNFTRFKNKKMDEMIEAGRVATTRAQRVKAYAEVQRILAGELPWIFLVQPRLLVVHKKNLKNVQLADQAESGVPWDNPLFNAARWVESR